MLSLAPQLEGWQFFPRISIQNQLVMRVDVTSLDLAKIEVINQSGSKGFTEFCFGITLPAEVAILDVKTSGEDRDHRIERREPSSRDVVEDLDTKARLGQVATIPASAAHELDFRVEKYQSSVSLLQRTWVIVLVVAVMTPLYLALAYVVSSTAILGAIFALVLLSLVIGIVVIPMSKKMK